MFVFLGLQISINVDSNSDDLLIFKSFLVL